MSLTTDRSVQIKPNREVVVDFSAAALRAPFALRCAALFIDYILIVAVPVLGLVIDRLIGGGPAKFSNNTAWFIAFLLGVSDLIIFPALSGQTLGMMMCRLRIVATDGGDPSVGRIIIRNTLGFLLTRFDPRIWFSFGGVHTERQSASRLRGGNDRYIRQ